MFLRILDDYIQSSRIIHSNSQTTQDGRFVGSRAEKSDSYVLETKEREDCFFVEPIFILILHLHSEQNFRKSLKKGSKIFKKRTSRSKIFSLISPSA